MLLGIQGIAIGKDLTDQASNAERLEYDFVKALPIGFSVDRIDSIIDGTDTNPVLIEVTEKVINPTPSEFTIDNLHLKVLTPDTQEIIAEQKGALPKPFTIHPDSTDNELTLQFSIHPQKAKRLIEQNGGGAVIALNRLTSPDYGITFILRGWVKVYGFSIDIDEKITI